MIFIVKNFCTDRQKPIFPPVFPAGPRDRATQRPFRLRKKKAEGAGTNLNKKYISESAAYFAAYILTTDILRRHIMRRKTEQYFIFFMLCSVIGWLYEVFLEVVVYRWGFSNRGVLFGPVLYHLRHRRADPAHLPGKTQREKMAYRKNSRHSRRRLFRYRSSDYGGGAGGKLYYGMDKGRMVLGLPSIFLQLSGAHRAEPEYPLRDRRYGHSVHHMASAGKGDAAFLRTGNRHPERGSGRYFSR